MKSEVIQDPGVLMTVTRVRERGDERRFRVGVREW